MKLDYNLVRRCRYPERCQNWSVTSCGCYSSSSSSTSQDVLRAQFSSTISLPIYLSVSLSPPLSLSISVSLSLYLSPSPLCSLPISNHYWLVRETAASLSFLLQHYHLCLVCLFWLGWFMWWEISVRVIVLCRVFLQRFVLIEGSFCTFHLAFSPGVLLHPSSTAIHSSVRYLWQITDL